MSKLFKDTTYEAAENIGKEFTPFAENMYLAEIVEIKVTEVQDTDWSGGAPVRTEEMVDQVEVTFLLESPIDGDKVLNCNGEESNFYTTKFWFSPIKLGTSQRGPSRARQFLCAVMGWDITAELSLSILEDLITAKKLEGKKIKLYLSLEERKDGSKKNKIERFLPVADTKVKK